MSTSCLQHSRASLLRYGVLAFPLAFIGLPLYVFAPAFYATEYGLSLTTMGFLLLGLRIVDAVQDPLIGVVSDKFVAHREHFVLVGALLLASGFWFLFHPFEQSLEVSFSLSILLAVSGYSIISINYQSMGALWSSDTLGRTRITSWREAIGLLGLLCAAIAPNLLGMNRGYQSTYHLLSLIFLPMLIIGMAVFIAWSRAAALDKAPKEKQSIGLSRLKNNWNIHFFSIYIANTFASAIPAVLVLFFINDRLEEPSLSGGFLLVYFLSGIIGMPFWQFIAAYVGKMNAWLLSIFANVLIFIWAFTLGSGDAIYYALICFLSGINLGADLSLPPSIMADRISARKDQAIASYYFSIKAFLFKSALALATGISLPILGQLGYQPGNIVDYSQTIYLSYAYALIPSALKLCVGIWLWCFIINNKSLQF